MKDYWKITISSDECPHKVYPTWTMKEEWTKGYCKLHDGEKRCCESICPLVKPQASELPSELSCSCGSDTIWKNGRCTGCGAMKL